MFLRLLFLTAAVAVLNPLAAYGSIVTHFSNGTAPGQFADVSRLLDQVGIGSTNVDAETTSTSLAVPGLPGSDVALTFSFVRDTGAFRFSFGYFDLNDVAGIDPVSDTAAWARQAVLLLFRSRLLLL